MLLQVAGRSSRCSSRCWSGSPSRRRHRHQRWPGAYPQGAGDPRPAGPGASNKAIAKALFVTPATVKTHLAHIYAKLGARSRHEALTQAFATGILALAPPRALVHKS